MALKAIIFDLDGVICNTDRCHYMAWKALADRLGIPFDEKTNNRLRGVSRMDSLNIVLEACARVFTEEEKQALAEEKNRTYRSLLQKLTPEDLSEDVRAALKDLHELRLKLAIGSSSKNAGLILKQLGLHGFFDAVADGTQISRSKPDPEVFLLAASMVGVQSRETLVVEDAASGIQAAKTGGFLTAGIGAAAHEAETDFSISALKDLIPICIGQRKCYAFGA